MKHLPAQAQPRVHTSRLPPSPNRYSAGCRCDDCRRANTEACRKYQRTFNGREYKRRWREAKLTEPAS